MKKIIFNILILGTLSSCNYLDVVPDNVATLDYAFRNRVSAHRYLATCYSKLPNFNDPFAGNIGLAGADELYINQEVGNVTATSIALGQQTNNGVLVDYWSGNAGGVNMWQGIRDCNIFLENIDKVVEMTTAEKEAWKGEVKFLKAYYHFYLLKSYGAIPIIKENESIDISPEEVQNITREPADKVFEYIVSLLDDAISTLPDRVLSPNEDLGRITKPIAMAMKGKVLLYYASPLFNGNGDYANFKNSRNENLFNANYESTRWEKAATALEEAIEYAHSLGYQLHYFEPGSSLNVSASTLKELDLRTAITQRWNSEIIWGETTNTFSQTATDRLQIGSMPRFRVNASPSPIVHNIGSGYSSVTLNHVERFYTKNGVPMEEDKTFNYDNIYDRPVAPDASNTKYVAAGHVTSPLNLNREPRFYAYLAFDGNLYFGQDALTDATRKELDYREMASNPTRMSVTGYNPKKLVNYLSSINNGTTFNQNYYPFPVIRLADLYLMYAEAANEAYGPNSMVYEYINLVRERAGLGSVQASWTNYSRFPDKYLTKEGMRDIIRGERTIELSFEGSRFWDLRRWKTAHIELNQTIRGWNVFSDNSQGYYNSTILNTQKFEFKHYFWPIRVSEMIKSPNIIQSPGW